MDKSPVVTLEQRARRYVPKVVRRSTRGFLLVLALLIVLYVMGEVWGNDRWAWPISWALAYLVFIVTLRALDTAPRVVYQNLAVMAAAFAIGVLGVLTDLDPLIVPVRATVTIYAIAAPIVILVHVLRSDHVTADVVTGAVCVYVLLGIDFAIIYDALARLDSNAFVFSNDTESVYYFSFMTLTTVGYGDVTPASELTRAVAVVEALAGQIFLVVMVARLVGMEIAERFSSRTSDESTAVDQRAP